MKKLGIFSIISFFVIILYLFIFSLPGISSADETREKRFKECIDSCNNKGQVCINMTADSRRCGAIVQECVDACKSEAESYKPANNQVKKESSTQANDQVVN
jgi:hypothetical protein